MDAVVFLLIGAALGWLLSRVRASASTTPPAVAAAPTPVVTQPAPAAAAPAPKPAADDDDEDASPPPAPPAEWPEEPRARAAAMGQYLAGVCNGADQGPDLERHPVFADLVDLLASDAFKLQDRTNWLTSRTTALSCAAIAAMSRVGDDGRHAVARASSGQGYLALHFGLLHLRDANDPVACGMLLLRAKPWWMGHPPSRAGFTAFLDRQLELGVVPSLGDGREEGDWKLDERTTTLRGIGHPLAERFIEELTRLDRLRRGEMEIALVGRALAPEDELPVAHIPVMDESIDKLVQSLRRPGRPSLVLLGPGGVGKSMLAREALRRLLREGWRVVEATPSQLMAGQKFIGEIDQRVQNFVDGLSAPRSVWFVPDCHQLLEKGTWSNNPHGILDLLMPHLESGAIQLLGESSIASWARVITQRPRIETLITALRVDAPGDSDALALARDWGERWQQRLGRPVLDAAVAAEACDLARHHFPERAEPGRTLDLLKEALANALRPEQPSLPLDREQLLAALARSSGLPLEILDIGRALDVDAVRAYFTARVIGQDEAVDALVDRISMLKAGLTDPHRPIGVFLFAGPTGTGKTEIAKALARYLFGSPERMLRFDMSEYQSDDAYWRLIEEGQEGRSASLTTRIRQNPFSVILLDEFEKAGPRIWDLFLQVFDDGRLTDRAGNTADFRHSLILLTSNLGSTIGKGGGPGFVAQAGGFSRELVQRAIDTTFRREFINRLDRVVVFNPLTRALMRDILHKELRDVLERRGFRGRAWAVEWEPSAIEFLLDKGFTPDLGARPLRRAIDRYLLAPLARTIVEHRVPSGEQFLFVQADGDGLRVRFVDPDAPTAGAPAAATSEPSDLRALALDPRADRATLDALGREIALRAARIDAPEWSALKDAAAQAMQQKDFWQRPERQRVLDRLERMDRIESGLRSAHSLHARLDRNAGRGAADLVRRLALLVSAIDAAIAAVIAGEPEDARIELRPVDQRSTPCLAWRDRLVQMYLRWGETRGMRVQRGGADAATGVVVLAVSGFGAYQALRAETGLHVLEVRLGDSEVRHSVRVRVSAFPASDEAAPAVAETRLCRRYDDGPAPLVRDSVRGWRTGRLDRVLDGDFDLLGTPSA